MVAPYIPEQGDLVILSFDPQAGHEQKGRRPALVISKYAFNEKSGLAFVCPITSTDRRHPFHIAISSSHLIRGVVMADQARSIDYRARQIQYMSKADPNLLQEVLARLEPILF